MPLDLAADVSGPDIYDEKLNPFGTQRDLKPKHAKEASEYALTANTVDSETDPRSFPEVIFNVRSIGAVEIIKDGEVIDFSSLDGIGEEPEIVDLRIHLDAIKYPSENFDPSISRMDGNHRLSRVPAIEDRGSDDLFPKISFALFIGLSKNQERKLFADINGKQEKVDVSYLAQISMALEGDRLLLNGQTRPLWFAKRLVESGEIFNNVVFTGGAKKGVVEALGYTPPINLALLKSMVAQTLRGLDPIVVSQMPPELLARAHTDKDGLKELVDNAQLLKTLISRFWTAVKKNYPEAWQDTKKVKYILFQSIGAIGLSQLAPVVINELVEKQTVKQEDFDSAISHVRNGGITLEKTNYAGLAGLAGARKVYEGLLEAKVAGGTGLTGVMGDLIEAKESRLD
jgi:DGQHR domain-containing protein